MNPRLRTAPKKARAAAAGDDMVRVAELPDGLEPEAEPVAVELPPVGGGPPELVAG